MRLLVIGSGSFAAGVAARQPADLILLFVTLMASTLGLAVLSFRIVTVVAAPHFAAAIERRLGDLIADRLDILELAIKNVGRAVIQLHRDELDDDGAALRLMLEGVDLEVERRLEESPRRPGLGRDRRRSS